MNAFNYNNISQYLYCISDQINTALLSIRPLSKNLKENMYCVICINGTSHIFSCFSIHSPLSFWTLDMKVNRFHLASWFIWASWLERNKKWIDKTLVVIVCLSHLDKIFSETFCTGTFILTLTKTTTACI